MPATCEIARQPGSEPTPALPRVTIAALVHRPEDEAEALLAELADMLLACGRDVRGVVERRVGPGKPGRVLEDLATGQRYPLFQSLGSGAGACSLDPGSVTAAGRALREALEQPPELAVANRFGALEASGGGLAAEMLALMAAGVPLLTVVAEGLLPVWREVTGGIASELPPRREALRAWSEGLPSACGPP